MIRLSYCNYVEIFMKVANSIKYASPRKKYQFKRSFLSSSTHNNFSFKTPPICILCFLQSMASSFIFLLLMFMHVFLSSCKVLYLPLSHSLSKTQFTTTHHLLKSTSSRSLARFRHQRRQQVSLPLSPGSDYTLSFSIGAKPAQSISLYMDTGSDLVWFPCSPFECILCEGKYNSSTITDTIFNLTSSSSSSVSCQSSSCSAVHSSLPNSDLCAISRCSLDSIEMSDCSSESCPPFYYAYADGSLIGHLYHDKLTIPSFAIDNFTFGCAHSTLAEPVGVAGFGRGVLSLPAQLAKFSPQLGSQFSYCLVSHSFDSDRIRRPSPLILGRHSIGVQEEDESKQSTNNNGGQYVYTAMLDNPKFPYFYTVGFEGISIGRSTIPSPAVMKRVDGSGNGGMVVDSGTTFTMFPASFYNSIVAAFNRRIGRVNKRARDVEDKTGLGPCYYFQDGETTSSSNQSFGMVPAVVLHFGGNSSVLLPRRNYFYDFIDGGDGVGKKRKVGCLMLMNGGDDSENSGPSATLGNYQQQGFEVVYDLESKRIGFAKRQCSLLWDSLNQG